MRHLSYPNAVSGDSALSANGSRGPAPSSRLEPLRYGPRRLSPPPHDARAARGRLRLALPAAVLSRVDLATPAASLGRRSALPRHVLPVQEIESLLATA